MALEHDRTVRQGTAADIAIGLLGDVMLGRGVGELLQAGTAEELWEPELRALTASLDAVVCNLECCISTRGEPTTLIPGKPFFFRAPVRAVDALEAVGVRAVTLANNHALDYGPQALADTVATLAAAGIWVTGAGADRRSARRAAAFAVGAREVVVVGVTDHPVEYAAAPAAPGVAYAASCADAPDWLLCEVRRARARGGLVIAFPHWGPNMAVRPAHRQRRLAAALQEAGADLVAGHSAHVFHGVQWTGAGPIVYDLGDALDDYRIDRQLRNDLGLLAIWRPGSAAAALELVGLRLRYARTGLAVGADAEWIGERLRGACAELGSRCVRVGEQRFRVEPA